TGTRIAGEGEGSAQRADDVQDVVGVRRGEPLGPRSDGVEDHLEGARPSSAASGLVDGERAAQEDVPPLGDGDLHELARPGTFGDVGSHQRERRVGAGSAVRKDLTSSTDHAPTSTVDARPGPVRSPDSSSTGRPAAWYRWSARGGGAAIRRASMACTAACRAGTVVMHGTPAATAAVRMKYPSVRDPRPNGVLITRSIRPPSIRSMAFGEPSDRLRTHAAGIPCRANTPAVPRVASSVNPRSPRRRTEAITARLSRLATDTKAVPVLGRLRPADSRAFASANPRESAMPMTSPVERISGPRTVSAPGN